ncbi:MAG: hypothetical protein LBC19_04650 [Tannerella sp.]|jgi:hypothetical protein|nr:hypothetical protein [Tannerella sp.]
MDKEALQLILNLQKKVDMYEMAFLDLLIVLKTEKEIIIPRHDDEVVSGVFCEIIELKRKLKAYEGRKQS